MEWQSTTDAPEGGVVMTKIDDDKGERNVAALKRSGRLWFTPDGGMCMYYTPTHYRELTAAERAIEIAGIEAKAAALAASTGSLRGKP